jgi:PAS domain S-box-containing protein
MDSNAVRILIVEDEPAHAEAIRRAFQAFMPHDEVHVVGSILKFREAVEDHIPSIAIMDIKLPDGSALEALSCPPECGPFPIVVMTSYGNEQVAVDAMKAGALDYVVKSPEAFTRMPRTVKSALREWRLIQQNKKAEDALQHSRDELQAIYDGSPVMMCTLDADRHILSANRAFIKATGWPRSDGKPDRACGVMGCINALDDQRGCGYGPHCDACPLRRAIVDTLVTSTEHENIECQFVLQNHDRLEHVTLLGSTTLVPSLNVPQILVCLLDITDRKQAEEYLRESEERYETFINATDDMVFLKDNQFRYLFVNNANVRFFEKSVPDILGADDFALMPTDAARGCRASDERALREKRVVIEEERIGGRIYESRKFPVHMKSDLIGVGGFIRDITEQRLAELNLKASLEQLRTYFYLPIIGIATTSGEKGWIDMNPKFCDMLGYSEEELRTKKMIDITPAEDMPKLEKVFSDILCGRISLPHTFEKRYIKKDGAIITTEIATDRVRGTAGEPDYFVSFVQDITGRKLAAEALQTSEEAIRALLNATDDGACILDLQFNFICLNQQMAARVGRTVDEIIGKNIFNFFSADLDAESMAHARAIMQSGTAGRFEDHHDGKIFDDSIYPIFDDKGVATRLAIFSRDITEQRHAEQALKDSIEHLRAYFYLPLIGIAKTSIEQGWLEINPKLCDMLGYTEAELRTLNPADISPADYIPPEINLYNDYIRGKTNLPFVYERRCVKKDGSIMYALISTDAIRDGDGNITSFVSFVQDITDRKRYEMDLKESEEKFRKLAELTSFAIMIYQDDNWVYTNPAGEHISGYTAEELYRKKYWEFVAEGYREKIIQKGIERQAGKGDSESHEFEIVTKDGFRKWVYLTGSSITYLGRPAGIISVVDITERKRTEAALRESEEKFRSIIDNSADGIYLFNDYGLITEWNRAAETITQLPKNTVLGRPVWDLYFNFVPDEEKEPAQLEKFRSQILGFLKTGTPKYSLMDINIQRPDGTRRVLQNSNFSVLLKDRFIFGVIVRDITDRKRDEDALRASLAEKEVMLREIHHRVKNNLQVVSSLVNLQANLTSNPTVLEALKTTSNRIRSMALLHEILYRDPNLAHIDFTVYVESLCRHIVLSSGEVASRVQIVTDIFNIGMPLEKSVPCGLIINELVTNAFKHAFPDNRAGSITVSLQPLAATNEQGKQLQLRVRDDGIGLPSGIDPLQTKSLGLKLVSTLALQLGATVAVEKPEAGGASFSVIFAASEDVEMEGK